MSVVQGKSVDLGGRRGLGKDHRTGNRLVVLVVTLPLTGRGAQGSVRFQVGGKALDLGNAHGQRSPRQEGVQRPSPIPPTPPATPSSSASVSSLPAALAFALTCSFACSAVKA